MVLANRACFIFICVIAVAGCDGGGAGGGGSSGAGGGGSGGAGGGGSSGAGGGGSGGAGEGGSSGAGGAGDPCAGLSLCSAAGTACDGDDVVHCAANLDGCLVETRTHCGAFDQTCDVGTAACVDGDPCAYIHPTDRCDTADERSCSGDLLEVCTTRTDGCLKIERVYCAATEDGFCDDTGAFAMCVDPIDYCELVPPSRRCDSAGLSCDSAVLVDCVPNEFGCLEATRVDCAATGEACVPGTPAACVDLCTGVDCSSFADYCNNGVCNIATGVCESVDVPDGTACPGDICAGGICTAGVCGPRLCEFGYFEDFELTDGGWVVGGTISTWAWGVAMDTPKPPSGTKVWGTNLAGDYSNNEDGYIESPSLDMTAATEDPFVRMWLYYQSEGSFDQGWLELSVDGGTTFNLVPSTAASFNWYNNVSDQRWDGDGGSWRVVQAQLVGTAGQSDVRLRMHFESDSSVRLHGFALDSVFIRTGLGADLALVSVNAGSECPTATTPLQVAVVNLGAAEVTSFELSITVDGGTPVVETVTTPIPVGASPVTFATTTTFDFTSAQLYRVEASVALPLDTVSSNDTAEATVAGILSLSAPYAESFDTNNGGWTGTGSWTHGTPIKSFISAAASGTGAWVTNLGGLPFEDEDSAVTSPCIDASGLSADPTLSFSHIFQLDADSYYTRGWIEVWTSGSNTWSLVGSYSSGGVNWYNDEFYDVWYDTSGAAGAWRTASHVLPGVAGQSLIRVRHRFENDYYDVTWEGIGLDDVAITP